MFPNLRVMVVALLASMVGIGCGLGALAALRVNHQPFTRLQSGDPPLQLAYGTGMPAAVSDGTPSPFGVRFEVKPQPSPRDMIAVPASPPPEPTAAPASDTGESVKPEAEQDSKAVVNAQAPQDDVDAIVAGLISDTAPQSVPTPAPAETAATDNLPAADQTTKTAALAPENNPENKNVMPVRFEAPVSLPAPQTAAPKEVRDHAAKRAKRAPAASTVPGETNFAAPTYQALQGSAAETAQSPGQAAQAAPRRIVKRHHPAKKAAAATTANTTAAITGGPATVATIKR